MNKGYANKIIVLFRKICMASPLLRPLLGAPLTLVFVRHAESSRNAAIPKGRLNFQTLNELARYGIADHKLPLTTHGREQAITIGGYLRRILHIMPDVIINSGYLRTIQTTDCLDYSHYNIPIVSNLSWREREGGYTHLMIESDVEKYLPYINKYWEETGNLFACPAGGKSLLEVLEQRVRPALYDLHRDFAGKTVLVVTHGNTIRCCRIHLDGMNIIEADQFVNTETTSDNCGITIYRYDPYQGKLILDPDHQGVNPLIDAMNSQN